jgi:phage baseplate assembly protein gpV
VSLLTIDRVMLQTVRASKIRGVQLAIVIDNKDGEGNPGYRVKVKYPWLNEQEASFWARIAVPMAGPGRGTYVLPEIDDQVLVVFEHGDIDRPIIIGGLWSTKQQPVEVNESDKNNTKLIKSRAGHRIIFDDKDGAEKITIVDKTKKNKIVLDSANNVLKIESDGDIEVIAKSNVIMHSNALQIGIAERVVAKSKSLLAHAQTTFALKATSSITIGGGNTTINTSNAAATSVFGSGAGELGGAAAEAPKEQRNEWLRGGGGAGGAGDGGAGSERGERSAAAGTRRNDGAPEDTTTFFELSLIDPDNQPLAGKRYRVTTPDGSIHDGMLDGRGSLRIDRIQPGTCLVTFPDLTNDARGKEHGSTSHTYA